MHDRSLALADEVGPPKRRPDAAGRVMILGAVSLQLGVLAALIAGNTAPYIGGRTVLLRVAPVDPRDLMRGDYVTLTYEIGGMTPARAGGGAVGTSGRRVYVSLVPEADGRHFKGSAASYSRPPAGPYIQGRVERSGRIRFGIESYYVQEGRGRDYERAVRERRLSAEVVLGSDGRPTLRGLVTE